MPSPTENGTNDANNGRQPPAGASAEYLKAYEVQKEANEKK